MVSTLSFLSLNEKLHQNNLSFRDFCFFRDLCYDSKASEHL